MADTTPSGQIIHPVLLIIDLLDQLDAQGLLTRLCQAGVLNLATIEHRQQYHHYQALRLTLRYQDYDQRTCAIEATAKHYRVTSATVYRALRLMQQQVSVNAHRKAPLACADGAYTILAVHFELLVDEAVD